MKITNYSNKAVSVCVSRWNKSGETSWFILRPGMGDNWGRSGWRGFIMGVSKNGKDDFYYIFEDSNVLIYEDYIEDFGRKIKPATDRYY
ncbi:hypothetical protein [Xenorhabdus sp. KJ12.1]|uniref:hypothetical protein n=1 Tax=Xenorhabdus sp. KJ12.1 TaxID=1851571 RepID=UPI000C057AF9|nr:hypothetical protein [Xenorhabdus sp. KJ12.1]PHM66897.1 hypothetical protein Xekj_04014 [Xenorhabdus sp. KJ12.1]